MSPVPLGRRALWVLPIVFIVCTLMVLPGSSVLGATQGKGASSSGTSAAVAPSPTTAGANNPFSPVDVANKLAAAHAADHPEAAPASTGLTSTANPQLYAQALDQIGARPGFTYGGVLSAIASQISAGKLSPSSVYLPNLQLLSAPRTPSQEVGVGYTANPAPMGIGDFGIGNQGAYAYNTSHVAGSLTLNAANATYPGAYYFITPPGSTNSSYNTPYEFGIQLNTVTTNVSIPGTDMGDFWTQNVVALDGNQLQFEDNIWNFTNVDGYLYPGTFWCGATGSGLCNGTLVAPSFYYDYGPVIKLTFPVSINLYNNISVVGHRDQVTFGYRVSDSVGTYHGIYDTVQFNATNASLAIPVGPRYTPGYEVNGKTSTPLGLNWDSELIFGGPGGGSNAVFNNISGTEKLQYENTTAAGWKTVPSAYDFGGDTGETAIGVAETWSPGGTVSLSPGPSLLYGLWNSQPSTAVPSGSIEFQGTVTPTYAFVLVWPFGGGYENVSLVPTTIGGGFLTYLPPSSAGWEYAAMADGYGLFGATPFTTSQIGLAISCGSVTPSFRTAPLYVDGNAQAQAAAAALTGWVSGPLKFQNLVLTSDIAGYSQNFNHLNDWGFVSFNLFQAVGVTDTLNVTNIVQGNTNVSGAGDNNYNMDGPAIGSPPTLLGIAPEITRSLPQYGELIALYSDTNVQVYDETSIGYIAGSPLDTSAHPYYNLNPAGGAVVLWSDPNANVTHTAALLGSYGVYVAGSTGFHDWVATAIAGANGVSVVGSTDAIVNDAVSIESVLWHNEEGTFAEIPYAIYDDGSIGGTFTDIEALAGGYGFAGYSSTGAVVNEVLTVGATLNITTNPNFVTYYSIGSYLVDAHHTSINDTFEEGGGIGVGAVFTLGTTVTNLTNEPFGYGLSWYLYGSDYTNISSAFDAVAVEGAYMFDAQNTTISNTEVYDAGYGIYGDVDNYTTFNDLFVEDNEYGVYMEDSFNTVFQNTLLDLNEYGIDLYYTWDSTFTELWVNATNEYGVWLDEAFTTSMSNVLLHGDIDDDIFAEDGSGLSVTNAYIDDGAFYGIYLEYWTGASFSMITVTNESFGIDVDPSNSISISNLAASEYSQGDEFYESSNVSVSGTTATNESLGDEFYEVSQASDTGVSVTNDSIGVEVYESEFVTVSHFKAAQATPAGLWTVEGIWYLPLAPVVTGEDEATTVTNGTATNYGAAVFDYDSYGLQVSQVNATSDEYGMVFNDTEYAVVNSLGAYKDYVGFLMGDDAEDNTVMGSSFVDDTSYGVAVVYGYYNIFTDNNFVGDNGATSTYSSSHIQAEAAGENFFNSCTEYAYGYCAAGVGNYWADWHIYGSNGFLAPYFIGGEAWDYFPIGPEETFAVNFVETGLPAGTTWSVTLNGVTVSAATTTISFTEPIGTYAFSIGALTGWTSSPSSGMLTVSDAAYNEPVAFSAILYAVTLTAGGLSTGTTWSATVNGVTQSTTGTSLVYQLPDGTYSYAFNNVSGYNLPTTGVSGSVTVANAPVSLSASYSPTSTPSYVTTNTFNDWLGVALALAVIALVIALLILLLGRGRRKDKDEPQGAQPWTPPPSGSTGGTSGGSGSWSEGPPPAGGSPPPSS